MKEDMRIALEVVMLISLIRFLIYSVVDIIGGITEPVVYFGTFATIIVIFYVDKNTDKLKRYFYFLYK